MEAPAQASFSVFRDEALKLIITETPSPERHILTISTTPGGAPLIEIPTQTGEIILWPASIQVLTEGSQYEYNIWSQDADGAIALRVRGQITITPSIAPFGVDAATTFLNNFATSGGPARLVVLTRSEYLALAAPDPATLYLITE